MPIYEYRCLKCGRESEEFIITLKEYSKDIFCKSCGGKMVKIMSTFTHHQSDVDRISTIDTKRPYDHDYFKDDRNIGGLAKKRLMEMGVPDGIQKVDNILSKARKSVKDAF